MTARKSNPSERGAALIEFAIVVPFLMIVLLGLVEIGRFSYFSILVANAARAGAQYGSQSMLTAVDTTGMSSAAKTDSGLSNLTVTPTDYCACADGTASTCLASDCASSHRLTYVKVSVSGTFDSLIGSGWLPNSITVTNAAVMQVGQ